MQLDKISEVISHFIGMFEISVEEARQQKSYDEFKAAEAVKEDTPDLPSTNINVKAPYTLDDFDPHVPYMPVPPELELIDRQGRASGLRRPKFPKSSI